MQPGPESSVGAQSADSILSKAPVANRRSFSMDLIIALALGVSGFAMAYLTWWSIAIAAGFASLAFVVDFRTRRGTARLTDDRAVGVSFGVYFLTLPLLGFAWLFVGQPPAWWQAGLLGLAMFGGYLSYARIIQRYELKRANSGDYSRYDWS